MKQELRSAIRSILATHPLAILGSSMMLAASISVTAEAAELPVVCFSGNCGSGGPNQWVTSGTASATQVHNTLTINQVTDRAVLNWSSFDVSADGRVIFNQPNANSIALNRIYQDSASRIFGTVEANGQIYLVNPNGFVFGRTARINAAGILASSLAISDQTFANGLLSPDLLRESRPALESDGRVNVLDRNGQLVLDENRSPLEVKLVVEEGAVLESRGSGGRVMLASRVIDNSGTISAPDGQALLAAGDRVFLQASDDPALRGLLVEVAAGGEAWNRMTGNITAARGNVTVAGLAVNQSGRISASTTVAANGSVRLIARDNPTFISEGDQMNLGPGQNGGRLEIGGSSRIEVLPELTDKATAVKDQEQLASSIELTGREIFLRSGSQITAPAGHLSVTAAGNVNDVAADTSARIRVETGTRIDLSGSDVTLPMSRNQVTVELRANELRDSPTQRNGALRGQTIVVDARIGTPLADVSGALAAIPKSVAERTSRGGTSVFNSQGDISVADGAHIDVSGGVTTYEGGPLATSQLIGADGHLYDIGEADPTRTYVGILNPVYRRADDRWGFVDTIAAQGISRMEPGYIAGSNAGTVQFAAPAIVMNGTLRAEAVVGPYQREPGKQPLGGQLIIGLPDGLSNTPTRDYRAPSVTFSPNGAIVAVGDDAPLPGQQTLLLPTDYLTRGGFTRTAIYSNGRITVPADTPLNLAAGSTMTLSGHQVDIAGNISTTGGAINATSVMTTGTGETLGRAGVAVDQGVTLDVRGNWTNDFLTARTDPFGRPSTSVFADGGSIALAIESQDAELVIGDQVQLLANGGAWMQRDGTIRGGDGGSIAIDAGGINSALQLGESINVQAFGMLGASGGEFALTAPRIEISSGTSWQQAQRLDPLEAELGYLSIGSSLFTDHGFRSVSLTAEGTVDPDQDGDALRIVAGTEIQARTSVLQLGDRSVDAASAANIAGLATVTVPEASAREAMNLAFSVTPVSPTQPDRIGLLSMQAGSSISTDAGSSISFANVGGIDINGAISARGGSIDTLLKNPAEANDVGYRPDLGIHIGADAVLDVSGTAVYRPVGDGVLSGTLFDGGKVSLQANRGFVVVDQGALIDVSGIGAAFDRNVSTTQGMTREVIASNAGSLSLIAPEAIAFNGTFRANAGVGQTGPATGGELVMRLSRQRGFAPGNSIVQPTFPTDPRVLRVTSEGIAIGGSAPPSGLAVLRRDVIDNSGIDALTLEADGRIEFDQISLAMNRRLVLDSPEILARDGANVSLSAPYLAIGNSVASRTGATPTTGTGSFNFQGGFIEAIGAVSLSGAVTTTIASTGDLRLRESQQGSAAAGHLQAAGDLTLRATQIYPSTLSSYTLSALGDHSTLRIESTGAATSTPLSAGGRLTLNAANIEQAGVLLAPFGSIDLNATESLSLAAGSVTSVSGNGALIPFGRVENGEWIYESGPRLVQTAIPERRIGLNAPSIEQDANATLDLRGGGDLYAYEWIPGTGGSKDALAADVTAGRYAIIPSQRGQFAPYDPQEMRASDLQVGDSVYLSGIPGLEPGFYALLPARYALLPGAMLIESVPNTTDIRPGSVSSLADGTPVVAGYRTFASTGLGGTRYSGFAIRPGSQARALAAYEDSLASKFYADRATRLEQPRPELPSDAGTLSLLATTSLDMRGIVNVSAAEGGRAGRVEVAASNLEVVNTVAGTSENVQIAASVLNSWRAGELWIGATKRGDVVDVVADSVRVADGASINADEVVLIANDDVTIAAGATVASTSGSRGASVDRDSLTDFNLQLTSDDAGAAVVSVSDRSLFNIVRAPGDLDVGSINAASGSVLSTGGALLADAPDHVVLNGDIRARDAVWQLGAGTVRFDEAAHDDGLNINSALLARMQEAGSLSIASANATEFYYSLNLGASNPLDALTLRAGSLNNFSGGDVSFSAAHVNLAGVAAAAGAPMGGTGALSINAGEIEIGDGNLSVNGFALTSLRATGDIRGAGKTNLRVGGDLDLAAARVTAANGGHTFIDATQGTVRISSTGTASSAIGGILGGALSIKADSIEHSGTLFLPSGLVELEAASNLSVASGGVIDVSGQLVRAADRVVGSSGGTVRLAAGGDLNAASGSRINVSGATDANAGRLSLHANGNANIAGELRSQAGGATATGGAFDLYAGSLANTGDLVARLQTSGFTERQSLHVRSGDLNLAPGQTVTARTIEWTTDQGRVQIDGTMRAPSTAQRSAIRLYGADVSIGSTARLNADANAGVRFGGDIELGSSTGSLSVSAGSQLSARGDELDGTLRLRAAATGTDVAISGFAGTVRDVDSVVVEAVRGYDVPAAVTSIEYDAILSDISTYMASAAGNIRTRLDSSGTLGVRVEAGAELRHVGDLQLDALDLSGWRFDNSPVALTVRSTGSITVNDTISDGFGVSAGRPTLLTGDSATLRFAAGADLASANPNALVRGAAGNFTLNAGAIVRTGTGDVRVSAAGDVIFNTASSIYTGGVAGAAAEGAFTFADRGGNVAITAGHDVLGSEVAQSVTDWQRRQGTAEGASIVRRTQWGTDLARFGWNAGTLGGGDMSIVAGNDVTNISATAADSAVEIVNNELTRFGGGSLSLSAGRDVNSAMLHVARSKGTVVADGALGSARVSEAGDALGSMIMMGDSQVSVLARANIDLEAVANPTALRQPGSTPTQTTAFFTYGNNSLLDVRSQGGDIALTTGNATRLYSFLGRPTVDANSSGLTVLPSSLSLLSLSNDIKLSGTMTLFPSDAGQLDLFAARDIQAGVGTVLTMSDTAANDVLTPLRPGSNFDYTDLTLSMSARHGADTVPAQVTAGRDIVAPILQLAKATKVSAGRDIVDTTLRTQNLRSSDITSVYAGRDLRYAPTLLTGQMTVGGPGRFDVMTGRNLDLGFSGGLTTTGRLVNPAIQAESGADLNVLVGMGGEVDGGAFVDDVIAPSEELRKSLLEFMIARTGNSSLTFEQAASGFKALDSSAQRPLLLNMFYGELVASGREANSDPRLGFQRGYDAIDALFPGSRPEEGEQNPFDGDLTLAFSRIYTLAGGDVSIAVPGGLVNVGLANPPPSIQQRPASELGIVAQRAGSVRIFTNDDVLVNQSRVFTLLGGDIAIWSTFGDIDAGRGSKSSVSAPPPAVLVDPTGRVTLDFAGAVAGSGIRTIATDDNIEPGDVDLIAPQGIVNAGDAGIGSAGNLNIAAQQVVGIDNIQVGGVSTGVPAETSGLGASLAAVSASASSSSSASTSSVEENDEADQAQASLAQTALSWLEVFVVGLGEENCKQDDVDCLKRQPLN